jgi:hypothetical protein
MNKFTTGDIYNQTAYLLNQLELLGNIDIVCNDGSVTVNINGNFTYVGKFGQNVSRAVIKHQSKNFAEKLVVLSAHMELYSRNFGGFCITNKK